MQTDVNKERMCPVAKTLSLIGGKMEGTAYLPLDRWEKTI